MLRISVNGQRVSDKKALCQLGLPIDRTDYLLLIAATLSKRNSAVASPI
jgi:hypothetical protein